MAKIAIQKCKNSGEAPKNLMEYCDSVTNLIRERAFDIFRGRNGEKIDVDNVAASLDNGILQIVAQKAAAKSKAASAAA